MVNFLQQILAINEEHTNHSAGDFYRIKVLTPLLTLIFTCFIQWFH